MEQKKLFAEVSQIEEDNRIFISRQLLLGTKFQEFLPIEIESAKGFIRLKYKANKLLNTNRTFIDGAGKVCVPTLFLRDIGVTSGDFIGTVLENDENIVFTPVYPKCCICNTHENLVFEKGYRSICRDCVLEIIEDTKNKL